MLALVACVVLAAHAQLNDFVIDDFSSGAQASTSNTGVTDSFGVGKNKTTVGGQRDIRGTVTSPASVIR